MTRLRQPTRRPPPCRTQRTRGTEGFAPRRCFAVARLGAVAAFCAACGSVSDDPSVEERAPGEPPSSETPDTEGASEPAGPSELAERIASISASARVDVFRGGRLYDNFYEENDGVGFAPDDASTPAADGDGGPFGDGTLPDSTGRVVPNALGHDYRAKNFFGWDLRGADGVYGPDYQNEAYVAGYNLLADGATRLDVARLIVDGAPGVPAFGEVLSEADLADIVAFVMAVREHELPRPDDIWSLDADAPSGYVLAPGANVEEGYAAIGGSCAACHGGDGTNIMFDDGEFTLGTLARASAYEVWFKIVAGNPGSPMGSQLPLAEPAPVQAQRVLDVLAALCDQTAFPRGAASEPDVPSGDVRCGAYLR